ncbi:hypothetical protein V6N11_028706 [Hibiscus sabdariffa]|uniref:Uncharacterized protein n=1 Tax=Hibiscus sabdariffa TaxID=183260 RepID=A0ABR2PQM0_9ROSI
MPDVKNLLLNDGRRKMTRSFEFDADAIDMLMFEAKSKSLEHPSRVLLLIKNKAQLSNYSIGNLYVSALATFNPIKKDIDLPKLGYVVRHASKTISNDSQDVLQGFKTMMEQLASL